MNKKILYVGSFCLPDCNAAAHRVWNNAKALCIYVNEVIFMDEQIDCPDNLEETKREIEGFTIYSKKRPRSILEHCKRMTDTRSIEYLLEKHSIDVLIVYDYPSFVTMRLRKKYKDRIKICADCTEWYTGKNRAFPLNVAICLDSFMRMRIVNPSLDGVICISKFLFSFYKDRTHCIKIPPLIDRSDDVWHQEINSGKRKRVRLICFDTPVMTTEKETILPVVKVVCCFSGAELVVVGLTEEQFKKKYNSTIEEKYRNRISFLGRVPYRESIRQIADSDYLAIWRRKNRVNKAGFSTKYVESISAGTKVISTDVGELREYNDRHDTGYIVDDEKALDKLLRDISSKGTDKVRTERDIFDIQRYSKDIEEWIETV